MKKLVLGICLMLSSFMFGQSEDDVVYYNLYWVKTVTYKDNSVEKVRIIEYDPSEYYIKRENITNMDTIGVLSYIGRQVVDSLNKIRVSKGLSIIENDGTYSEDEYGYAEESIFDYQLKRQTPLMVTDFDYDMGECSCVNNVISEILSHKDIMKRVLSKRNKVLNVCIIVDKKTNTFYTYIQVKRLFTMTYFIG
jgi:hypothetical protein